MSRARIHVCFVCLGNICRSPTAEGVMRRIVEDRGLEERIAIDSAGTAAYHVGDLPDERSRQAASRRGVRLESRARQFVVDDLERFDFVLAMDRENFENLAKLSPGHERIGNLALLRSFDPLAKSDAEVSDPYYGGDRGFEDVLDQCEAACRGLLDAILERADFD
jgi:protein-tyrosine phosphatase